MYRWLDEHQNQTPSGPVSFISGGIVSDYLRSPRSWLEGQTALLHFAKKKKEMGA